MEAIPFEYVMRLLAAVLFGGMIGLERELQDKPVGLRSNILICLGAALFTLLSLILTKDHGEPTRVAAQIVTGIGFLGAGAIIRQGERVQGITTAATIWLVASLGMGAGAGLYAITGTGTVLALAVLLGFRRLEAALDTWYVTRTYSFAFVPEATEEGLRAAEAAIQGSGMRCRMRHVDVSEGRRRQSVRLAGRAARHAALEESLVRLEGLWELKVL